MKNSVIIDGVRSPIGLKNGKLIGMRADDLSAQVVKGLLKRNERFVLSIKIGNMSTIM